jgi:hypothetical protein
MNISSPHGTLDIVVEDNLVFIEAEGPWNIEYLEQLHEQLIKAVLKVDRNNYAVLITPKGEAISVEAGFEYHLNFIRHGNAKAVALNLAQCTTALLTESIFTKLYRMAGVKHAFFDNSFDARQWLENELKTTTVTVV